MGTLGLVVLGPARAPAAIGPCPVFPGDHILNTRVDTLPVHPRSAQFIASIGANTTLHADFGSGLWEGNVIGIPYITVPGTQPLVPIVFTDYGHQSDPGPYRIPPGAPIEGASNPDGDRHVLVADVGNCVLYELYRGFGPFPPDNRWEAGSGAKYDLRGYALRPDTWTSADAAGLPIFPLLVRHDEVLAGEIRHAIRFTAQVTRTAHVWPARHDAGSTSNPNAPAMGQRFRLKAGKDISGFPPKVRIILQAFKTYGLILADNGSNWYIGGAPHPGWDNDELNSSFDLLRGSDFEAVDVSSLQIDPNSAQARPPVPPVFTGGVYLAAGDVKGQGKADVITGAGPGGGPHVRVFDGLTGHAVKEFMAYDPAFTGGVYVAAGDVTGDGAADIITSAGPGGGPHVQVFDGVSGALVRSFFAYDPAFTGGVYVAAGDVNGDGVADIITGAGAGGGPHVQAFDGATGAVIRSFFAYDPAFTGGVRVAAGIVTAGGTAAIVTSVGPGGGPHVRVFDGLTGHVVREFMAYDPAFTGGVYVAAGDVNGDGVAEIITGAGAGGGPHVQVFDGATGTLVGSFFAYDPGFTGGVRLAVGNVNGTGPGEILTGPGPGGGPHVRIFTGAGVDFGVGFFAY
jgi:hypothetical protein